VSVDWVRNPEKVCVCPACGYVAARRKFSRCTCSRCRYEAAGSHFPTLAEMMNEDTGLWNDVDMRLFISALMSLAGGRRK